MIKLIVGVSGSGKSRGLRADVYQHVKTHAGGVIAPDYEYDWQSAPQSISRYIATETTVAACVRSIKNGARLVIYRPAEYDQRSRLLQCETIARWVMERPGRGIAMTEAHRVFPNKGILSGEMDRLITAYRHAGVGSDRGEAHVWLDTQRLTLISRTVTENATLLRLHAIAGEVDLRRCREIGGRELEGAVRECARRLRAGEPGWYIDLEAHRMGPYELKRDP